MTASRNTGDLDKSDRVHQLAPSIPFTDQLHNVIGGAVMQNLTLRVSKTIEIRFVLLLLLLLRNEFIHSDQDQTRSVLDRIRHDQGFPNLLRKMAG